MKGNASKSKARTYDMPDVSEWEGRDAPYKRVLDHSYQPTKADLEMEISVAMLQRLSEKQATSEKLSASLRSVIRCVQPTTTPGTSSRTPS